MERHGFFHTIRDKIFEKCGEYICIDSMNGWIRADNIDFYWNSDWGEQLDEIDAFGRNVSDHPMLVDAHESGRHSLELTFSLPFVDAAKPEDAEYWADWLISLYEYPKEVEARIAERQKLTK